MPSYYTLDARHTDPELPINVQLNLEEASVNFQPQQNVIFEHAFISVILSTFHVYHYLPIVQSSQYPRVHARYYRFDANMIPNRDISLM